MVNNQFKVPFQDQLIKYSVIDIDDLLLDLIEWRWMYLAGRMQKHVVDVVSPSSRITFAMKKNRSSAFQVVEPSLTFLRDFNFFEGLRFYIHVEF